MTPPVIDNASTQITDKALIELVRRLDPFFQGRSSRGGGATIADLLDITDFTTTVVDARTLEIGDGIFLTQPSTFVAHIATLLDYASRILTHVGSDLVSYWKMEAASGVQPDYAQNGAGDQDLSAQTGGGPAGTYDVSGGLAAPFDDGAFRFNYNQAVNDASGAGVGGAYFEASDTRWNFLGTASMSVECLFKPTAGWSIGDRDAQIVGSIGGSPGDAFLRGWGLVFHGPSGTLANQVGFVRAAGTGTGPGQEMRANSGATTLTAGTWYLLTGTYDGSTVRLYIDGVLVGSSASAVSVPSRSDIRVGAGGFALDVARYVYGAVDEVAVYSACLTAGQVFGNAQAAGLIDPGTINPYDIDHGALSGLADDDHTQYHNDTRGDARYPLKSIVTTAGDLLVASASAVLTRLGLGSDDQVLVVDSGSSPKVQWQTRIKSLKKTGGTALTGAVELDEGANITITPSGQKLVIAATPGSGGGSGFVSSDTIWDAKGDIAAATGADAAVRVAVGADYTSLHALSSATPGMSYMPGGSILLYDYTVAGSDKASIDTGSDTPDAGIAGTSAFPALRVLEIFTYIRTDEVVVGSPIAFVNNNDGAGTTYDQMNVNGVNATAGAANALARANWLISNSGASAGANYFSTTNFRIPNYAGTVGYKMADAALARADSTAANNVVALYALTWKNTAAITRFAMSPATALKKFKVGTRLLIYVR